MAATVGLSQKFGRAGLCPSLAAGQLDAHHLKLLQAAAEAWDRACEAQSILSRDGLIIAGREGGVRPHPAVAIRRDAEVSFARLLRELDLDTEPASGLRTAPPSLRSNRRGL